uniref:Fatty acid synthase subunit alpha n=1 Tax=Chromera velia CCMP2878 TaxID=1169474 RepID=A0A0G4FWX6_9ALVE|eukprot:Cvel_3823.t1-p1 / transcript=Cvel_3823.t1 / gene=Cvel_3823 / organism=Chromera_velia_CCMP2878 / gene_product=Fatty acid synthase subunit alpha, putative / transcript_product=Fatty acid synthase subunit alpha, putative / location=Cvel_scaffold161:59405-81911(+) / protein_length=3825 / sequence_SO=supercontig / SO=protein_coding / is_pseudo=false
MGDLDRKTAQFSSALLGLAKKGEVGLVAHFGGQAVPFMSELRRVYNSCAFAQRLVDKCSQDLRKELAKEEVVLLGCHRQGMDLEAWLRDESAVPSSEYLLTGPVSYPLIVLTQLANFLSVMRELGITPSEFADEKMLHASCGHSSGILAAAAVACGGTLEEFTERARKTVLLAFWHGLRAQQAFPPRRVERELLQQAYDLKTRRPTPMLAVGNISRAALESKIKFINASVPKHSRVGISLINQFNRFVVSGDPNSLVRLRASLTEMEAPPDDPKQSRVPFSLRKRQLFCTFLDVSTPFHTPHLASAFDHILADAERIGFILTPDMLKVPLLSTSDGSDLRDLKGDSGSALLHNLVKLQLTEINDWTAVCARVALHERKGHVHVLDFGCGGKGGVAKATAAQTRGAGVTVVFLSEVASEPGAPGRPALLTDKREEVPFHEDWGEVYGPKVRRDPLGRLVLHTKFTEVFRKPPVMVPGMTPTTVKPEFCSAVINAGYHVEVAGGGQHTEKIFASTCEDIVKNVPAGEGITVNLLFLNPYLWKFQFPLILKLRREGTPIEGITIAAGVPSEANANRICQDLLSVGISKIGFKPGTATAVLEVLKIAEANPEMTVVLQWSGGRAGGHHSYEDQFEAMLETYHKIRRHANVILIAGGGIGDADSAAAWVTGQWSVGFRQPRMPFDGVMMGSRVMVCKEAPTAKEVKTLITETKGVSEENQADWEKSYMDDAGGVVTLLSELGEPIHKIGNRGARLWRMLDDKYFKLQGDELKKALDKDWREIAEALNRDFQKPFFPCKADGSLCRDIGDMTYSEVITQMLRRMRTSHTHHANSNRDRPVWIDVSYRTRLGLWLQRIAERFGVLGDDPLFSEEELETSPDTAIDRLKKKCSGQMDVRLLHPADRDFFFDMAKIVWMKPLNFVPIIDVNLRYWVKKDSLWYSEAIEIVPDRDPGRVLVLQGPVATFYSKEANEPVKSVLDGVHEGMIKSIGGMREKEMRLVEGVEGDFSPEPSPMEIQEAVDLSVSGEDLKRDPKTWLKQLVGAADFGWRHALLLSTHIVRGTNWLPNDIAALFHPRKGQRVVVSPQLQSIEVFDPVMSKLGLGEDVPAVTASLQPFDERDAYRSISILIRHPLPANNDWGKTPGRRAPIELDLRYEYHPDRPQSPLVEEEYHERCCKIAAFYRAVWMPHVTCDEDVSTHRETEVNAEAVQKFRGAIGDFVGLEDPDETNPAAPLEFSFVAAWHSLLGCLMTPEPGQKSVGGDLFRLVHLSNEFEVLDPKHESRDFRLGEVLECDAEKWAVWDRPEGRVVTVKAYVRRKGAEKPSVCITSEFLFRGPLMDSCEQIRKRQVDRLIQIRDAETIEVFMSKKWHSIPSGTLKVGSVVRLSAETVERRASSSETASVFTTTGTVVVDGALVSTIEAATHHAASCPVVAFCSRHGEEVVKKRDMDAPAAYRTLPDMSPVSNVPYGTASLDTNPLHVSPFAAALAGLKAPIVHGMLSMARARQMVEAAVGNQTLQFKAEFVGMVLSSVPLRCKTSLVATSSGRRCVRWELVGRNPGSASEFLAAKGTAEIGQAPTAYMFTGQGSASAGMGMDLYGSSEAARRTWDSADAFLKGKYGFSILDIVRQNPKQHFVSFLGSDGEALRKNYQALKVFKEFDAAGQPKDAGTPIFPEAFDADCPGVTFKSPSGLLFSTQFTQPAIMLFGKSRMEDMKSRGVVQPAAMFAGHSLGEYVSLCCMVDADPSRLAELVFLRGLTMQAAVPRDSKARSRYGMISLSPKRIGAWFSDEHMHASIDAIASLGQRLLQIVNYNVRGHQYIVAGDLTALEALRVAGDGLKKARDLQMDGARPGKEMMSIISAAWDAAEKKEKDAFDEKDAKFAGFVPLTRGSATVPLPTIDVPFHSRLLLGGVPTFRHLLEDAIGSLASIIDDLDNRYVPNLVGIPFAATREFVETAAAQCGSSRLKAMLQDWKERSRNLTKTRQPNAHLSTLQVRTELLVELLAFQFASPVQWIKTQDSFLKNDRKNFVEIGPAPVLSGMMKQRLAALPSSRAFWVERDAEAVYMRDESMEEEEEDIQEENQQETTPPQAAAQPAQAAKPAAAAAAAAPAPKPAAAAPPPRTDLKSGGGPVDLPLSALHSLQVLIATKLGLALNELTPSSTIRGLCGGKSAIQNEILGDLAAEFGAEPDGAGDAPLDSLSKAVGAKYKKTGKILSSSVSRVFSRAMPGGFTQSKAKDWLMSHWQLSASTVENVFIHTLIMEPASRLGSEADAKTWIEGVARSYVEGIGGVGMSAAASGGGGGGGGGSGGAVVDAKAIEDLKAMLAKMGRVVKSYADPDVLPSDEGLDESDEEAVAMALREVMDLEHGMKYAKLVKPMFDERQARDYSSWWAWGRQAALEFILKGTVAPDPKVWDINARHREEMVIDRISNCSSFPALEELVRFHCDSPDEAHARRAQMLINAIQSRPGHARGKAVWKELRASAKPRIFIKDDGNVENAPFQRHADGVKTFAEEMFTPPSKPEQKDCRFKLGEAVAGSLEHRDPNGDIQKLFASAMKGVAGDGQTWSGKVALLTGCAVNNICMEVCRGFLRGGAHVIVTTFFPQRGSICSFEVFRDFFVDQAGAGGRLTVLPMNGASWIDTQGVMNHIYENVLPKGKGIDFCFPFAAIPEHGRDITALDGVSEAAHRAMLTNVIRMLGLIADKQPSSTPAHVVLPLSPNRGLFGGDGLYAESKVGLEALFGKWRAEGWRSRLSLVGAEMGWVRGTGLMSVNDLIAPAIEAKCGMRTFDTVEIGFTLLCLCSPKIVAAARRHPLRADLSGGFRAMGATGIPSANLRGEIQRVQKAKKAVTADNLADREAIEGGQKAAPFLLPKAKERRANPTLRFPSLPTSSRLGGLRDLRGFLDLSRVVVCVGYGEVGPWGSSRTRWEMELDGKLSLEGAVELARSMQLIRFHTGPLESTGEPYTGWVDASDESPVAEGEILEKFGEKIRKHAGIRRVEPELFKGYTPAKKMFLQTRALEVDLEPFEVASEDEAAFLKNFHGKNLEITEKDGKRFAQLKKGSVVYIPKSSHFDREVAGQIPSGWKAENFGLPKDLEGRIDPVTHYALVATMDAFCMAGITDPYELYKYLHVSEVGNCIGGGMGGMVNLRGIFRGRLLEEEVNSDSLQETFINTTAAWINMLLLSASGPIKTPVDACATGAMSVGVGVETIRTGKAKVVLCGAVEDFGEEGSYEFAKMKATSSSDKEFGMGRAPDEMCRPFSPTRGGFMESQGCGIQILATADVALEMGLPIYCVVADVSTAMDREGRSVPAPGKGCLTTAREIPERVAGPSPLLDLNYRKEMLKRDLKHVEEWAEDAKKRHVFDPQFISKEVRRREDALRRLWSSDFWHDDPQIAPLRGALATFGLSIDDLDVCSFHGTGTAANDVSVSQNESSVVQRQMKHLGRTSGNPIPTVWQKWLTGHPKGPAASWMFNGVVQCLLSGKISGSRTSDDVDLKLQQNDLLLYCNRPMDVGRPLKAGYLHSFGFGQAGAEAVLVHPDFLFAGVEREVMPAYQRKRDRREQEANKYWLSALLGKSTLIQVKTRAPYKSEDAEATYLDPTARATADEEGEWHITPSPLAVSPSKGGLKRQRSPMLDESQTDLEKLGRQAVKQVGALGLQKIAEAVPGGPKGSDREALVASLEKMAKDLRGNAGVESFPGIDVEKLDFFAKLPGSNDLSGTFHKRNFTDAELQYCRAAPNPTASLAGRWCAKEAVVKALTGAGASVNPLLSLWKGEGDPLRDIEVVRLSSGLPTVKLHGHAAEVASAVGVSEVHLSISHTDEHACAHASAMRRG